MRQQQSIKITPSKIICDDLVQNQLLVMIIGCWPGGLSIGRLTVCRLTVCRLAICRLSISRLTVGRLTVGRLTVGRLLLRLCNYDSGGIIALVVFGRLHSELRLQSSLLPPLHQDNNDNDQNDDTGNGTPSCPANSSAVAAAAVIVPCVGGTIVLVA